jgi:hypothetical protein
MNPEAQLLFNDTQATFLLTRQHLAGCSRFATSSAQTSFETAMHSFLDGDGNPRPQRSTGKSPSSLSRFYNKALWNLHMFNQHLQKTALSRILSARNQARGQARTVEAALDLSTLEKTGDFPDLPVSVFNAVLGLHLVVLYVMVGHERQPFSFAIWKGKGFATPVMLALALLKQLKRALPVGISVRALADTGFGSGAFVDGAAKLGFHVVTGMPCDRTTVQGKRLDQLSMRGSRVDLTCCSTPVWVSWYRLKLKDGKFEWLIEAFFKVMKSRFGLDQFGQRTLHGAIRFLTLAFLAFMLTAVSRTTLMMGVLPDWRFLALALRRVLVPCLVALRLELERELLEAASGLHCDFMRAAA